MIKCNYISNLRKVFSFFLIIFSTALYSQVWNKPELKFTSACATRGVFNEFSVDVSYKDAPFIDPNNSFTLELSDPNGSFDDPSKVISLKNNIKESSFSFTIKFQLQEGIYGDKYRVRVKSTHPVIESEDSDEFPAYFLPSVRPTLNNFEDIVLCSGTTSTEIGVTFSDGVTDPEVFQYQWFLDDVPYQVAGSKITASQPGNYSAKIIASGDCSIQSSNVINLSFFDSLDVEINDGGSSALICANETFTFKTDIEDRSYKYKWYRDGKLIEGLPDYSPTYTTPDNDQLGAYYLEIEADNGCKNRSQGFALQPKIDGSFEVDISGAKTQILIPGQSVRLVSGVSVSSSYKYQWFLDGKPITGGNRSSTGAAVPGVYYVVVTDDSSSCAVSVTSPETTILEVNSLATTIRTSTNYEDCVSSETTLSIVGVKAEATDGQEYDLSSEQIEELTYQWLKEGVPVSGAVQKELKIGSYEENGEYSLQVSISSLSSESEKLIVALGLEAEVASTSPSNTLCPGLPITLSVNLTSGVTYTWSKDDVDLTVTDPSSLEVTEAGMYKLTYEGLGCKKDIEVEVKEFDESVIEVSPSTTAVLPPGSTISLSASGADSYEWYDENNKLLSENESVDVSELGNYKLVSKVGSCTAEKQIQVVEDDGKVTIPNVLTPFNGDGVNDTWQLPNRFAFQPNVQVIIYNSSGQEVLNTTDYQNNWPQNNNIKDGMLFYFKVIKKNSLVKAGTISVLE